MQKFLAGIASLGLVGILVLSVWSQPQDGKGGAGKGGVGKEGDKKGGGFDKKGPPMPFEIGKVLPLHLYDMLELTQDQKAQIADLEKEVKSKLTKILKEDQVKKIEAYKDKGKMDGKDKGKGKDDGKDGKDKDGTTEKKAGQPRPDMDSNLKKPSQIQWFASLDRGLIEAQKSGLPILFLSAAPHCAGVSGTW